MSRAIKILGLALILASVGVVAYADSHEPAVYVWINGMKAQPGQSEALTGLLIEEGNKNYNSLVESGAALEWGVAMPIFHDGNDPVSHYEWITFAGWEGVDAFMAAFMAGQETKSEEDRKAESQRFASAVVAGSHHDIVNYSEHIGSMGLSRAGFIHLMYLTAKPGMAGDGTKFLKEGASTVYDKLLADGAIQNYGFHTPAIHRSYDWTHMLWFTSEGMVARQAVSSGFDAADPAMMEKAMGIFEADHLDQTLMVIHHHVGGGDG